MLIDGGRESGVATSLLEGSNLIVLKVCYLFKIARYGPSSPLPSLLYDLFCSHACQESSVIHSIGNLGIHGQGILNLSGDGDTIQAQRLILSLFYNIVVK